MRKKITKIAIIIEVTKRELPFFSILEDILTTEGFKVKLIPFRSMCTWRLLRFRPDIILVNGIRTTYPYYYSQIALPKQLFNAKVACYYSEQVGYYEESLAQSYKNQLVFDNVDFHIGWGPRFCRDLELAGVNHSKLWYLGSLQYDIDVYYNKCADSEKKNLAKKYGIDDSKKWILYADNIIKDYQPQECYAKRRQDSFEVVKRAAEKNPNAIVIFRTHPDTSKEEIDTIKEYFKGIDNVVFNNQEHIFYWTLSCDAEIVWCSTSSIQALFLNKPVFGFMTSDKQDLKMYWYRDVFPLYEDYSQLAEDIRTTFDGKLTDFEKDIRDARAKYIAEWYFKKDGLSFNRFVSLFKHIESSKVHPLYGEECNISLQTLLKILYFELRAHIGNLLRRRDFETNVTRNDIRAEKQKYDLSRYRHLEFEIKQSESGFYFEKWQNL